MKSSSVDQNWRGWKECGPGLIPHMVRRTESLQRRFRDTFCHILNPRKKELVSRHKPKPHNEWTLQKVESSTAAIIVLEKRNRAGMFLDHDEPREKEKNSIKHWRWGYYWNLLISLPPCMEYSRRPNKLCIPQIIKHSTSFSTSEELELIRHASLLSADLSKADLRWLRCGMMPRQNMKYERITIPLKGYRPIKSYSYFSVEGSSDLVTDLKGQSQDPNKRSTVEVKKRVVSQVIPTGPFSFPLFSWHKSMNKLMMIMPP